MQVTRALVCAVSCACVIVAHADDRPSQHRAATGWKAGYAEADITPQPGDPVMPAGYGKRRIMDGTESPLRAQALALEDAEGDRAILFTADVLGFGRITVDAVRHKLQNAHGIPPEAVCFASSHTHWGPAVNYRTGSNVGDVNIWYLSFLEATLLELAAEALQNVAPAEVAYGNCEVHIGMCRRSRNEHGQFGWGCDPDGSYDPHTPIVRVRREESPQQVVIVGHACHPTSMGELDQWSPDYPGAMRRKLESELHDSRAMFVMGCGGDAKVVHQNPATGKYEFAASPDLSYQAGFTLADAVLSRIGGDQKLDRLDGKLDATLVRGTLSLQPARSRKQIEDMAMGGNLRSISTWWARKNLAFPDDRREMEYTVQSWRLGSLTLTALEGEVCADWGPLARSLAETEHAMTIGYANEVSCYIPTARIIGEGGYEGESAHMVYLLPAPFEPRMEVELTALIRRAIAQLSGDGVLDAPIYPDREQLLVTLTADGQTEPVTSPEQWEVRRRHIIANIEKVMGPPPGRSFRVPLDLDVTEEVDCGSYTRKTITYNVDPHDRVESYLLVPHNLRERSPAILALHGTHPLGKRSVVGLIDEATDRGRRRFYGHELAERGYVVIAPDYWYYGLYKGQDYTPYQRGYASATMKGVWNHMRAIDVLETLPEVDANRIGAIGQSLGGYNTLFLGTFDPRVKAMVSSAGYNSFFDYAASEYGGGDLKNWGIDKHMRRIWTVYNNDPAQVPFDFPELIGALAPRPVFTNAPTHDEYFALTGVKKCLEAARPIYELIGNVDDLQARFPEAGHDFPDAERQASYEFLDRYLRD